MKNIFDFGNIGNSEKAIKKTWCEFREALAKGLFTYKEVDKAKEQTFLRVYDDLFHRNSGIEHKTITVSELKGQTVGRGTVLNKSEIPDYERFIPKKEFIKDDNRFSPPGIEWLYLAIGNDKNIHDCAEAECRANSGDRFGFCHFQFDSQYDECKLVDLTIADDVSYEELNTVLEEGSVK